MSEAPGDDEPPPLPGGWSRMYALVGGLLVAEVLVFGLLTWWAS